MAEGQFTDCSLVPCQFSRRTGPQAQVLDEKELVEDDGEGTKVKALAMELFMVLILLEVFNF